MVESIEEVPTDAPSHTAVEKSKPRPRSLAEVLAGQFEALQNYHRAVLETDDPEAIHKMRVTTRRAQAGLDLLAGELRVRNYDVFLILIEKEVSRARPAYRSQFELVKAILQKRRTERAKDVRKYLAKIKVGDIPAKLGLNAVAPASETSHHAPVESAGAEITKPAVTARPKTLAVDERKIAERAADRLEQRVAEFYDLAAQAHAATRAEELHQLRIAAKRVRYLLELISQMGFGDATRAVAWLRSMQDRIGDWHDLESLEEEIIEIVSHRRFLKEHIAESSRMLQAAAHLQKKKQALVARLFPVRVPKSIALTSQRMARRLRSSSTRNKPAVRGAAPPAKS
ncbi:MAG TPA: CHAD domain-containing protein [Blastocatellia bacterium]|nr:CHAD domain-containing protein [Blastocatellia bacterium]